MATATTAGAQDANPNSERRRILMRKNALWTERSSWDTHWRDIAEYQHPTLGRFTTDEVNKGKGGKRRSITDSTAVFAARTLSAGMMSGMTSPARPWFRLALPDEELMEAAPVREWLHKTTKLLLAIFGASNTYRALHSCYTELGLFGTWADIVLPNFDNVIHHHPLTVGSYALATDDNGRVNTVYRQLAMTVEQMVLRFGKDNVSNAVKNLYDKGTYDARVDVIHAIEPRRDRDHTKRDAMNMPWRSVYIEAGSENHDKLLSESGFKTFRALCPRWTVTEGDVYGDSPGAECAGDVRQLQHEQLRKGQGIDYQTNPPLQVPTAYKEAAKGRLPGGIMYVDVNSPTGGVRSAFEVNLNLQHLLEDIHDVRERIRSAYYADLFLMLANDTRSGVTATEIAERHEEKLLMLGPVLERLHNELLSPLIEMTMDDCEAAGILPEPPQQIQGMEIKVDFVSVLAQAQRAVAVNGMDRLFGFVGQAAGIAPELRHKVNWLKAADVYGDAYGVDPEILNPDEHVAQVMEQEAIQAAQAQTAAMAPGMASAAKDASQIDTDGMNQVMDMFSGYGAGQGGLGPGSAM